MSSSFGKGWAQSLPTFTADYSKDCSTTYKVLKFKFNNAKDWIILQLNWGNSLLFPGRPESLVLTLIQDKNEMCQLVNYNVAQFEISLEALKVSVSTSFRNVLIESVHQVIQPEFAARFFQWDIQISTGNFAWGFLKASFFMHIFIPILKLKLDFGDQPLQCVCTQEFQNVNF